MYRRFIFLAFFFIASYGFSSPPNSLVTDLKVAEHLLEQAEKQTQERQLKGKIKTASRELEILRKRVHEGSVTNAILPLLSFQKRLRSYSQQDILQKTQLHLSKILASQKVFRALRRKEFGVQILELSVPEGRFNFYFPDDVKEGDSFTYSVQMQLFGSTDIDHAENQKTLSQYRIEFASRPLSISTTLQQVSVGSAPSSAEIVMKTLEGFETLKTELSFASKTNSNEAAQASPQTSAELEIDSNLPREPMIDIDIPHLLFQLPKLNQAGRFLEIRGPFDGIAENTALSVNKNGTFILAESPRKTIAFNPRLTGGQEIRLLEGEKRVRCRYRNVDLRSWASVETLASGARAAYTIQLDAATDVNTPIIIALENRTPEIISLENGSFQYITVDPATLNEAGSLTLSRILTGMHPAPFRIDARLDTTYLFSTCNPPD